MGSWSTHNGLRWQLGPVQTTRLAGVCRRCVRYSNAWAVHSIDQWLYIHIYTESRPVSMQTPCPKIHLTGRLGHPLHKVRDTPAVVCSNRSKRTYESEVYLSDSMKPIKSQFESWNNVVETTQLSSILTATEVIRANQVTDQPTLQFVETCPVGEFSVRLPWASLARWQRILFR